MIDDLRRRLLRHVRSLESELSDSDRFASLSGDEYFRDRDQRRNVERWAENIVNAMVDAAKLSLTIEKLPLGGSYREILASVSAMPEFEGLDTRVPASWTRLRNILSHEDLDVRWPILRAFVREAPSAARDFLDRAKDFLARVSSH